MSFYIKKRILVILFILITIPIFSQGWNSPQELNIPSTDNSNLDLFTNREGNHILVAYADYPTYYLKYYLVNSSGTVVRSHQFESQYVNFANIDGNNDNLYIVYKLGNAIKTWKSTNQGQNWTALDNKTTSSNPCNNVDITWGKDDNTLHMVWATQDSEDDFETYYSKLNNNQWTASENVTDDSYVGGMPTVSKSNNRVHVSYNTGQNVSPSLNFGEAKSRDKFYNNWQIPQTVYTTTSFRERIHAGSSKLFDFFYKFEWGGGFYYSDLYVKERGFNETTWSSPYYLHVYSDVNNIVSATNTINGNTHIVYWTHLGTDYRSYSNGLWTDETLILDAKNSPRIYAVSNDLFVVAGSYNNIYYCQYDAIPLAPQNLQVTRSLNNHPYLTWSANTEPDFDHYIVEKAYQGGWTTLSQTTNTYFEDPNETYCTAPPPQVCDGERTVTYHVSAVDKHPYTSLPSEVKTNVTGGYPPDKAVAQISEMPGKYELGQNYPNPFNPSTSITYSLKNPEFVTLKIFDMLGREVAELVNENKPEGKYTVEFNSGDLPSGIYIYKLDAGKFSDMKKMLLIK